MYFKSDNSGLKNIVFGHIYHEKQHLGYCAKHALNNLFQKEEFTINELNKICRLLKAQEGNSNFIRHKSILPIGNYDINVIMWALNTYGKEIKWFDNRRIDEIDLLDTENLYGIIINKGNNGAVFNKHWYTLRPIYKDKVKIVVHETKIKTESPPSSQSKETFDNNQNDKENIEFNKPPTIPSPSLTTTITTKTNILIEPHKDNYTSTIESIDNDTTNNHQINMEEDENNEYPWWNLDSKLIKPVRFLSKEALIFHLKCQIVNNSQILLIYNK